MPDWPAENNQKSSYEFYKFFFLTFLRLIVKFSAFELPSDLSLHQGRRSMEISWQASTLVNQLEKTSTKNTKKMLAAQRKCAQAFPERRILDKKKSGDQIRSESW